MAECAPLRSKHIEQEEVMFDKTFLAFTRFTSRFSSRTWHSASGPGRQGLFRAGQVHTARAKWARIL